MNAALKLLSVAVTLNCSTFALGTPYSFLRVYTGPALPGVAINDNGIVALIYGSTGYYSLITTDGHTSTTIAGTGAANYLSQYDLSGAMHVLSLNNSGFVAFLGHSADGKLGILASNGATTYKVAADKSNGGTFDNIGSSARSINDNGLVAFSAYTTAAGWRLYLGNGSGTPTRLDTGITPSMPAVNNGGVVAYTDTTGFSTKIFHGTQTLVLPGTPVGGCMPDINGLGVAAFCASVSGVQKVVVGDGVSSPTYIDGSLFAGGLTQGLVFDGGASDCAINSHGLVAFGACRDGQAAGYGIFLGSNPSTDKVIMQGDSLGGATVTNLCFSRDGLNNAGQIAFVAWLSDGTEGVFVATPVPEPGAFVLLAVGAAGLLGWVWRRRDRR